MKPYHILAIDDDLELLDTHALRLRSEGWEVETASSLTQANEILVDSTPDLLILDRMFEGHDQTEDSITWLANLRQHHNPQIQHVRVLMLTHRNEADDEADELEAGANYHLSKPFSYRQLVAVVKSILRDRDSQAPVQTNYLQVGPLVVNTETLQVMCDGQEIVTAEKEFRLLRFFADNPEQIFSKDEILSDVWGEEYLSTPTRLVENYVKILRQMAKDVNPDYIVPIFTVHSRGYVHRKVAKLGRIVIDYTNRSVSYEDQLLEVSAKELQFMTAFAKRAGRPRLSLDKTQLMREILDDDSAEIHTLDTLFKTLRDKLQASNCILPIVEYEDSYRFRKSLT